MLEKKLLTLACAAGILACGACFGPISSPPPLPPPLLDLHGIQSIQVVVTSVSESHHLNLSDLAGRVTYFINWQTQHTGVSAYAQQQAEPGDAVLQITILSETVDLSSSPPLTARKKLPFLIKVSATLTRQDGQVIWHETDAEYLVHYSFKPEDSSDVWKDTFLRNYVTNQLSSRLVHRMFYRR
jgi:hypothetical protein